MGGKTFERSAVSDILDALDKAPELIHLIVGPRQIGKTTAALQLIDRYPRKSLYASADEPLPPAAEWIRVHWERARRDSCGLLVIDEIQKVRGWSEVVKKLHDEDGREGRNFRVLLLGSSALLIGKGLSESLAGRFFLHRLTHWDYPEMRDAFGLSLDEWIFFGGYPGAAAYRGDEKFWKNYVRDSLIETVFSKDILQMETVHKPALLRHLFYLAADYPAEILSYNKMLGQLVDAGNTTTLAHYLTLLDSAYLVSGLEQFKPGGNSKRGSSPKFVVRNGGLVGACFGGSFQTSRNEPELWGRLVENAVGLALMNRAEAHSRKLYYWRKGNDEVDYVLTAGKKVWALEVKSSRMKSPRGLQAFMKLYPAAVPVIVGGGGIPLEEFFGSVDSIFS